MMLIYHYSIAKWYLASHIISQLVQGFKHDFLVIDGVI